MKFITTLLLALMLTPVSYAGKSYELRLTVRDIYSRELLANCPVRVMYEGNDEVSIQQITNDNGAAVFSELTSNLVLVTVITKNGDYNEIDLKFGLSANRTTNYTVYLYPADDYKNSLTMREDSLYGEVSDDFLKIGAPPEDSLCVKIDTSYNEPQINGGAVGLQRFVSQNVNYPEYCIENDEMGKVFLRFVVEPDGKITHIKIEKSASMYLDREAIRVIQSMPNWDPADCGETKIRTIARMPIVYRLE